MLSQEIHCPSLLAPRGARPGSVLRAPAIERLLARAERLSHADDDPVAALLRAAGCAWPTGEDAPSAPVALLGEGVAVESGAVWMHADPIHLRPDRDRLRVYAGSAVRVERDEADALVAAFNRHFAGAGLSLLAPAAGRWYLKCDRPWPDLQTTPLHRLQGSVLPGELPCGPAARDWRRLLNETQMLFHADPINRQRESRARPGISGIWLWGAGVLPPLSGTVPDEFIGDHPLLSGLARLAARPHRSLDAWLDDPQPRRGHQLVLWDRHWRSWLDHDPEAWSHAMAELETVIARLWTPLRAGRLSAIRLIDSSQATAFCIASRQTWRLWRRRAPI